jgi:hypothetical protein
MTSTATKKRIILAAAVEALILIPSIVYAIFFK